MAFRAELNQLITLFRTMGGLSGFSVTHRANALAAEAKALHRSLHMKLCDTIRSGPVHYAGGGGSGMFSYDRLSRSIVMRADPWRELSTMGTWIADATVLRWAELTAEISQGTLRPSQIIDQLLTPPIEERNVFAARGVYEALHQVIAWRSRLFVD